MTDRPRPESEILPEALTTRVLARASELDAAQNTGSRISELRAAAAEAGISASAFDAALAEVQGAEPAQVPAVKVSTRRRTRSWAAVAAIVALVVGFVFTRLVVPVPTATVEQTFNLRCLSSGQAAELVGPLLDRRSSTIVMSPDRAPGAITIRTTAAQMEKVRSVLDQYVGGSGPACPSPPAPPATP